eukprot:SAG22_NODE_576_length_8982_cov_21.167736_8_plen_78_part_00
MTTLWLTAKAATAAAALAAAAPGDDDDDDDGGEGSCTVWVCWRPRDSAAASSPAAAAGPVVPVVGGWASLHRKLQVV